MSEMTKKISRWSIGALMLAMVTSPSLAHADNSTDDMDFYQHLQAHGINLGTLQYTVNVAMTLCQDLNAGDSQKDEIDELTQSGLLTQEQAERFVGAATGEYCPDKHPGAKPSG
ncbi:MAG: DUF732 domain-containing protein [Mycobacterium sp.]